MESDPEVPPASPRHVRLGLVSCRAPIGKQRPTGSGPRPHRTAADRRKDDQSRPTMLFCSEVIEETPVQVMTLFQSVLILLI